MNRAQRSNTMRKRHTFWRQWKNRSTIFARCEVTSPIFFLLFSMSTVTAGFIHALLPKSRHWTKYYKTEHLKFRYLHYIQLAPAFITHAQKHLSTTQQYPSASISIFKCPLFFLMDCDRIW